MAPSRIESTQPIAAELRAAGAYVAPDREIVALIAYLQKLGKSESVVPQAAANR